MFVCRPIEKYSLIVFWLSQATSSNTNIELGSASFGSMTSRLLEMRSSRYHLSIWVVLPNIDILVEREISNTRTRFRNVHHVDFLSNLSKRLFYHSWTVHRWCNELYSVVKGRVYESFQAFHQTWVASCGRDSTLLSLVIVVRIAFTRVTCMRDVTRASFSALFILSSRRSIRTVYCKEQLLLFQTCFSY